MVNLTQEKISKVAFKFLDKNGNLCGSVFTASGYKKWLLNPGIPVSEEFHKKKLYICKTPKIAKERLEFELNNWLKGLKEDI